MRRVSSDGCTDDGEDARTDDGADTECGERYRSERFLQGVLGMFALGDQLVDGLCGKDLSGQRRVLAGGVVTVKLKRL